MIFMKKYLNIYEEVILNGKDLPNFCFASVSRINLSGIMLKFVWKCQNVANFLDAWK